MKEVELIGVNVEGGVFDGVSKTLHHGRNRPCRVQGRGLKTRLTYIGRVKVSLIGFMNDKKEHRVTSTWVTSQFKT